LSLLATARRRAALLSALILAAVALPAAASRGDLAGRYAQDSQQASQLQAAIKADDHTIEGYEGTIADLQARLVLVAQSVATQERLLAQVRAALASARANLAYLQAQYAHDRRTLAAQLVAQYESPAPTVTDVVLSAHGFQDLLGKLDTLRTLARANAQAAQASPKIINPIRITTSTGVIDHLLEKEQQPHQRSIQARRPLYTDAPH